jgi:hypothetical protein
MPDAAQPNTLVKIALLACLSLVIACSDDSPTKSTPPPPPPPPGANAVAEFSIQDVNPNSARSGEMVSPRDYLGSVSAWYFGHAT